MTVDALAQDLEERPPVPGLASGVEARDPTPDDQAIISQADYRAYIERLATRKIKGFCGTIDENGAYYSEVYAGNASLTESITADYHGRFLIELIQNANDVHPDTRRDGEIEIIFDQFHGEPGTLYIANRGSAFSEKNVNALCDMGLSSKPPGESIGNKGLGFRSVHHISDRPLIYSQAGAPNDPIQFEGFCFGFANDIDIDVLIENPRNRVLAKQDLPLFHVPKWLDDQPETIKEFARRGFATVIVLPLRDASAAEAVENEITAFRNQTVPMLLFLTRLYRLTVRVVSADCERHRDFSLTRSEVPVRAVNVIFALVDLDNSGRFLIARRQVPESSMKAAIKDGTEKKQLHKHWLKWEGDGEVALAVRLDELVVAPRLFTFLPMGEQATAPFCGYLHGTFFPTSNRKGLDASIRLNALLLDEATTLAAAAIACLTQNEAVGLEHGLDATTKARAVCDFLSWRKVDSLETKLDLGAQVATELAKQSAAPAFDDALVVPCLVTRDGNPTVAWAAPSHARRWRYELETFSAAVAAAYSASTQIAPVWPGLGPRIDRLNAYLTKHAPRYVEFPTAAERADLATKVASDLAANRRTPIGWWAAYYRDLAIFLDKVGGALAGHRLLLCADGKLHRTMSPVVEAEGKPRRRHRKGEIEASVFSPPARRGAGADGEDQITPPDSLAENFAFLSNRLDWYGELASARLFLENAKLVFAFDREVVLAQLSRVLRQDGRNSARAAGLRWAFHLWRQPRETGRAFKLQAQHRFFVPTIDGEFIEGGEAIFSESWPEETRGRLIQRFLNSAPSDIEDLKRLSNRRLAPRSHYAFRGSKADLWVEFLVELGVQQGLHPVTKKVTSSTVRAHRLENFSFCGDLGISSSAAAAWKADVDASKPGATRLPYDTDYVVRGEIWWLPGQGDIDQFSRDCREYYAMLIIAWLGQTALPTWTIEIHHYHFSNADSREWPTPVAAFLRSASWIPADEPSSEGTLPVIVRLSDIWLAPEGGNERFPSFLRRPAIPVMRMLERAGQDLIKTLQSRARLRVLNQTATLIEQAEFLAQQYDRDGFDRYYERHFLNLYHRTWILLADRLATGGFNLASETGPQTLVVRRGSNTEVVHLPSPDTQLAEPIYVRDGDDETIASLIEVSGRLLFDPRAANSTRIGVLLRKLYGNRVRLLSEADYSMIADGQEVGAGDVASILSCCPRLRVLVAIAIEALKGTELQRLPADRYSIVARLDRLVLQQVSTISFRIDGVDIAHEIDERRAFSLKVPDGRPIVVVRTGGKLSWEVIEESLGAICEAIEQPALEPHLRLLIFALANGGNSVDSIPPADLELGWLCGLLRLSEIARRSVRETLGARLERHIPWLRAIIHMGGGADGIDAFAQQEVAAVQDIARLREALSPWLQALELSVDAVLDACKSALGIAELRENLQLDFEMLNRSLVAVGEKPDTYPDLQASFLSNYIHENELAIIDALRAAHADTLARNEPAPAYVKAREAVRSLAPDPEWLLRYKEVPAERISEHVAAWLEENGALAPNANPHSLQPLDEVRRFNGIAIRKFVTKANPLVKAWCSKAGVAFSAIWREADGGMGALRAAFDNAGILDYRALDESALLGWSAIVGVWPNQMPKSLDKADLNIVEEDFDTESAKARAEAEARKREARSIPFNGRKIDPEEVDWQALADELAASLSKNMLSTPLGSLANLAPAKERRERPGRPGPSGPAGTPPPRAPSQKTDMIGRLGEVAVYHWLRDRLPKQNIDAAWLSKSPL